MSNSMAQYARQQSFSPGVGSAANLSTSISDLPQSQIDAIIRTKRKAREPKACYPCHTRKVKCDRNLPCDGCVKRDHADLCSYERPSKKLQTATPQAYSGNMINAAEGFAAPPDVQVKSENAESVPAPSSVDRSVSVPREDWDNVCNKLKEMEQTILSLRTGLEQIDDGRPPVDPSTELRSSDGSQRSERASPEREGIHTANTLGEGTIHLGSRSVLAYILNKSGSLQAQALLEGGILPKLGLDNETATYPFVDLWSSDTSTFDVSAVCEALPSDQQIREFFFFYRDIAGTLYPVLVDVPGFEKDLESLLRNRSATGGVLKASGDQGLSQRPFGMSLAFIGLLFAVLASGCQSSDLLGTERELTSQVYVCCSYQCLRMTNFVSQPTLEAIKTLLIIGNVLSYNMNPGVSYVLLGMTLRMGIALGLHVESNRFPPTERYTRRHIWWSMAWQDSHFSLSYDRPSTVAVSQPDISYRPESVPGERDYFETMCRIISLTLEVVRGRMLTPHFHMSFKAIQAYEERLQHILADAAPHLRDRKYCLSPMSHLQRLALRVHSSYIRSELCRPALKSTADKNDPLLAKVRRDCVDSLIGTVESYIELHSFSSHGSRAWITLQRAISSAFLLAVIDEAKSEPNIRELLHELEITIIERATAEGEFENAEVANGRMTSPQAVGSVNPGSQVNTIPGMTNAHLSVSDSFFNSQPMEVPASGAVDTRAQWAKPLINSLRALQKLNAAFTVYGSSTNGVGNSTSPYGSNAVAPGLSGYPGSSSVGNTTTISPNMGSVPPPTPGSSSSSDWTFPNLLDRAAEYIHPPLWG